MNEQKHLLYKRLCGVLCIIFCAALIFCIIIWLKNAEDNLFVVINGHEINVDIANTNNTRAQGLGGRKNLCAKCGMLFLFDTLEERTFWMKDMLFDIDIVWIREGMIVQISENVDHTYGMREIVHSSDPVDAVLELPVGSIYKNNIIIGQHVTYSAGIVE